MQPLSNVSADLATLAEGVPTVSNAQIGQTTANGPLASTLNFDVSVPDASQAASARATWQAAIFIGAVASRVAATPGMPRLSEIGVTLVAPDGTRTPIGGGIGNVVPNQQFNDVTSATTSDILARARTLGFSDTKIETIRGIQPALMITTTAADPAAAVAKLRQRGSALTNFLGEAPSNYEGVYLEIRDTAGSPVYSEGVAPRDGAGMAWTRQGSGIQVGNRARLKY
jgi:hypothetical protein